MMRFFPAGLAAIVNGSIAWLTDTMNIALLKLDGTVTDVAVKAITGATNATPIVVTAAGHGGTTGDVVVIRGVLGNTAANGTWRITVLDANTFSLQTLVVSDSVSVAGNGIYTSGGCVLNLTLGDDFADIDACVVGAPVALSGRAVLAGGVLDADDPTIAAFTGTAHAWVIYEPGGKNLFFNDGKQRVSAVVQHAVGSTLLNIEPLEGPMDEGATFTLSNGANIRLAAAALAGARMLNIDPLDVAVNGGGRHGDAPLSGAGLPLSAAGDSVQILFDAAGIGAV